MSPIRTRAAALTAAAGLALALGAGCASDRPVLYPNPKYQEVGPETAEYHVDTCVRLAEEFNARSGSQLPEGTAGDVVEDSTVGAATGAAVAAAVGADVGRGAAAGAAGGAARTFVRSIFRGARAHDYDTAFHRFVEICLERQGYQLVGWS